MSTPSDKCQTSHKVIFADGSFVNIIHNLDPEPGERIIARIEWAHGSGTWPVGIIDAILNVWQRHSDIRWKSFEQAMTLPSGRILFWRFRPQEPCAACLQSASSVIGKGLFEAPPTSLAPETAADYRDAIRRAITPEKFAATLATLPAEAQKRITDKHLAEPPVIRRVKIRAQRRN
jgi:hypothetical protein